jgi:hypothetical protein
LQSRIKAWQVRQEQQERLGQQQRQERLGQQRQEQQERLGQQRQEQQQEQRQEQRLLLFCRKRSKQRRPTKRRTKRIWSW